MPDADPANPTGYGYDGTRFVQRILYIGDTLYTLSQAEVMAHNLIDLAEEGSLDIPPEME